MKKEKEKMLMISAASEALKYKSKNPGVNSERIIKHVMSSLDYKISGIAAVNEVLKIKESNPNLKDKQVIQALMDNIEKILVQTQEEKE